jgi:hypothetical protein
MTKQRGSFLTKIMKGWNEKSFPRDILKMREILICPGWFGWSLSGEFCNSEDSSHSYHPRQNSGQCFRVEFLPMGDMAIFPLTLMRKTHIERLLLRCHSTYEGHKNRHNYYKTTTNKIGSLPHMKFENQFSVDSGFICQMQNL